MDKSIFTPEFKAQVVEFYKTNTSAQTTEKFGVSQRTIITWSTKLGFVKGNSRYPTDFKHEVCQYYDNHTHNETVEKFGIAEITLFKWRRELGYRNKSRGYNLYTESLQPVVQKRERKNFMITKKENGQLQAQVVELQQRLEKVEADARLLKSVKALFMEVQ